MSEQAQTTSQRKLKFWHIAAILALALAVAFGVYRLTLRAKLQQRIEAVRAAGYPMTPEELDAWYEMPPHGENAAEYISDAISYLKIPSAADAENLPFFHRRQLPPRTEPLDEETQTLIAQVLDDNKKVLELLDRASALASSRYPIDLSQGRATLLPHIGDLRKVAFLLCLKAIAEVERGRPTAAVDALANTFQVAASLAQEPITISQLVRQACQGIALSTTEWVINRVSLDDDQLKRIEMFLANAYDPDASIRGFAGERCIRMLTFREPGKLGLPPIFPTQDPSVLQIRIAQALGQVDGYMLKDLDLTERQIAAMRLPAQERLQAGREIDLLAGKVRSAHKTLGHFMPPLSRFVEIDLMNLTRIRVARVAVVVERCRVMRGRHPQDLNELIPTFLDSAPIDPYDGQPLRYRKFQPGFVVYSIGEDLSDDEGKRRQRRKRGQGPEPNYDLSFSVER